MGSLPLPTPAPDGIAAGDRPAGSSSPVAAERSAATAPAPRRSTRERILDIALVLFNEQGYEKTSLREIAQRLGTTKAALYYHFERKEDILLELHLRIHALGRDGLATLESLPDAPARVAAWPGVIDELIDQVVEHRDLFLFHQLNYNALKALDGNERHQAENVDLEHLLRRVIASADIPMADRVRMVCSLGAAIGGLIGGGALFGDVPIGEVAEHVRATVRDMFPPRPPSS